MSLGIVKVKHELLQVLSMRTRGQATLMIAPDVKPKNQILLAKGSVSPPPECKDTNAYIVDLYLNRFPGQKTMSRPFVSPRDQVVKEIDVTRLKRLVRLNFEFDFKRRPVNPRMERVGDQEHLAFDTESWATADEGVMARSIFDEWRKTRCLKTLSDFLNWQDYYTTVVSMEGLRKQHIGHGLQVTREGSVGILKRVFVRAYVREKWGVKKSLPYKRVAELLEACGCPASADDVKNGNKGKLTPRIVPRTPLTETVFAKMQEVFEGLDPTMFFISQDDARINP